MYNDLEHPIEICFNLPIYQNYVRESNFQSIQSQFQTVFDDLKSDGVFKSRQDWNSHKLSDTTFTSNLLDQYNLNLFKQELDDHIYSYLKIINSPVVEKPETFTYTISGSWMTLTEKYQYAHIHSHGSSDLSGVYYFKTNKEDGNIFFQDPNKMTSASYCFSHINSRQEFTPAPGKLLLFPGWLEHGVTTNTTDNERVSISFNIQFKR
jgi:uncharacterized protein (TIGR02466 family)